MVYCRECGKEIGIKDKFCPSCGAGAEKHPEETKTQVSGEKTVPVKPAVAQQPGKAAGKAVGIVVFIITIAAIFFIFSAAGLDLFDFGDVGDCEPKTGKVSCGFCASTMQCQYCPTGYYCNFATPGDTCSKLTCSSGSGVTNNTTIAETYCNKGYCLSNGHCCPSSSKYYCEGKCYESSNAANSASSGRCSGNFTIYC